MRFVPIKSIEQQGKLFVHRAQQGYVAHRTELINRIRGLLSELGIILPKAYKAFRRGAHQVLEDLPGYCNQVIGDLLSELDHIEERIAKGERQIAQMARQDPDAQYAMRVRGIGAKTASATTAAVGDGHEFRNGRQFSAWMGWPPRQHSSGGKARLGSITKAGDPYLRSLFLMGARSVLLHAAHRDDPVSRWALKLKERRGYGRAVVAIAAKNARLCWAAMQLKDKFKVPA